MVGDRSGRPPHRCGEDACLGPELAGWPVDSRHAPGLLWKADFFLRGRIVDAGALWFDTPMNRLRPLLVHLLCTAPYHVAFTFSGADDETKVADAIGEAFDAVLENSHVGGITPDGTAHRVVVFKVPDPAGDTESPPLGP